MTGSFATLVMGYPLRSAVLVGISLAQVGEFSLILGKAGLENMILDLNAYQAFLGVSLVTMALTPFCMNAARRSPTCLSGCRSLRIISGLRPLKVMLMKISPPGRRTTS